MILHQTVHTSQKDFPLSFFFLEHAGELRIIILEEKGRARDRLQIYILTPYTSYTAYTQVTSASILEDKLATYLVRWRLRRQVGYSSCPSHLHTFRSSSACVIAAAIQGAAPSKTHLFRCFHNVQAPRTTNELNPF
jgi:hypothetical protein